MNSIRAYWNALQTIIDDGIMCKEHGCGAAGMILIQEDTSCEICYNGRDDEEMRDSMDTVATGVGDQL